ncbi:phosphotransferase [Natronococcus sp. A-GB1]|uniref:phosphotransferase family protein n=1 Tax=Natronococcus sp. A-GB1 TaxID=3037648 RepID=UPI00241FC943|nr:phosphotransferase [Natronococcus sp. A-GB1]MDG5761372.1 phosphotransferase [Natronococcus sp. A-GB1]
MDERGDDLVDAVLEDVFSGRTVETVGETGPSWNDRNRTVRIAFREADPVFLKVAVDGDGSRIACERAAIEYVDEHCDVIVPTVLASEPDGRVPYLLTAPLGETLSLEWSDWSDGKRVDVTRQVGAALAALHVRRFDRHGHVTDGDASGLELETGAWTDVLVERIAWMRELASSDRFDHHFDAVVGAVEDNRERLDEAPATLVHGDPAQPNCVRGETGTGFVDWELAHVGDPARELHRAEDQLLPETATNASELRDALREGYRREQGSIPKGVDERAPVYDAVRQLGRSGFFDKWVTLTGESEATVVKRIESEMQRRLDAIR